jgi:hypothetical protein
MSPHGCYLCPRSVHRDKKVTKEARFQLGGRHHALDVARALRLACPARTPCYRRPQSLRHRFRSADRRLNRSPHDTVVPCRGFRVTALCGVARPWKVPRCFRPALFEPDRRGARLDADTCWAGVGKFKRGLLIQTFGPAKVWSPAGARPGALQRIGEAPASRATNQPTNQPTIHPSRPPLDTPAPSPCGKLPGSPPTSSRRHTPWAH